MKLYDKKVSFSEIILYHIVTYKPKFFGLLKSEVMEYVITYSISEDRINFKKIYKGKIIDDHHTKNGYEQSIKIMDGIKERYERIYFADIKEGKIKFMYSKYGSDEAERMRLRIIQSLLITKMKNMKQE